MSFGSESEVRFRQNRYGVVCKGRASEIHVAVMTRKGCTIATQKDSQAVCGINDGAGSHRQDILGSFVADVLVLSEESRTGKLACPIESREYSQLGVASKLLDNWRSRSGAHGNLNGGPYRR